jgi:hypothetical protein
VSAKLPGKATFLPNSVHLSLICKAHLHCRKILHFQERDRSIPDGREDLLRILSEKYPSHHYDLESIESYHDEHNGPNKLYAADIVDPFTQTGLNRVVPDGPGACLRHVTIRIASHGAAILAPLTTYPPIAIHSFIYVRASIHQDGIRVILVG